MKQKILALVLISWLGIYLAEDVADLIFTKEKVKIENVKEENQEAKEKEVKFFDCCFQSQTDWLTPTKNFELHLVTQVYTCVFSSEPLFRLFHSYIFYH